MEYELRKNNTGFTLIELMVSVTIFSIVMTVAAGSLFSIMEGNRKAHAIQSVMNNLDFAIESMSRSIRMGSHYNFDCTSGSCPTPQTSFQFVSSDGKALTYALPTGSDQIVRLVCDYSGGVAMNCPSTPSAITAPEVHITYLGFYVTGASVSGGLMQPRVVLVVDGYSGETAQSRTEFNIETAISQRQPR